MFMSSEIHVSKNGEIIYVDILLNIILLTVVLYL